MGTCREDTGGQREGGGAVKALSPFVLCCLVFKPQCSLLKAGVILDLNDHACRWTWTVTLNGIGAARLANTT